MLKGRTLSLGCLYLLIFLALVPVLQIRKRIFVAAYSRFCCALCSCFIIEIRFSVITFGCVLRSPVDLAVGSPCRVVPLNRAVTSVSLKSRVDIKV